MEARYDYLDATKWYMISKIYYIIIVVRVDKEYINDIHFKNTFNLAEIIDLCRSELPTHLKVSAYADKPQNF